MSIYIKTHHVLYTDQNFPEKLEKSKIWRERKQNGLTIKTLEDFAKEMGYEFVTELKPNVYYADGDIIDVASKQPLTLSSHLQRFYEESIIKAVGKYSVHQYKVPTQKTKHLDGLLLLKKLKRMVTTEPARYQHYRD